MLVINTNAKKVEVKINASYGVDYVHIQPKGRATLSEGQTVDANWMASHGAGIRIIENPEQAVTPTVPVPKSSTPDSEE